MIEEIIIIFGIIYIIIWIFYKDSVSEFRINQVEWAKRGNISALLSEKVPIVIRGIPPISVWTHEDVMNRDIYHSVPIFKDKLLSTWISDVKGVEALDCPWDIPHARILGEKSAFQTWVDKWLSDWIIQPSWKWLWRMYPSCWTGSRPMFRTVAPWTAIVPTVGEIMVSILPSKDYDYALPKNWRELWIPRINRYDTPFAGELKFMDIRLRPGHILLLPAHWYASWEESDLDADEREEMGMEIPIMITMMEFHTVFSILEDWKELKFSSGWRNRKNADIKQKLRQSSPPAFPAPPAPLFSEYKEEIQDFPVSLSDIQSNISQYNPVPSDKSGDVDETHIRYEQYSDIYREPGDGADQNRTIQPYREFSE